MPEGLICLSGCVGSELSQHLLHDRFAEAEKLAAWYRRVFGEEHFFVEIQDNGVQIQPRPGRAGRRPGPPHGPASRRHQRRPLPRPGRQPGPRHPPLRQHGQDDRRPRPDEVRDRPGSTSARPTRCTEAMRGQDEALARSVGHRRAPSRRTTRA
ncbi:MAG: PHP domain-containing protein [Isosphaeraceae bacterium]